MLKSFTAVLAILSFCCVALLQTKAQAAPTAHETNEQHDARMNWWREAKFGLFIHWEFYTVPAGERSGKDIYGDWIMCNCKIPVKECAYFATKFNPETFDAKAWVKMAKDASMQYIMITSKHHDGFAMFHSKADTFNIFDATPFKRAPLKELADECQKQGICMSSIWPKDCKLVLDGTYAQATKAYWQADADRTPPRKNPSLPRSK